MSNFKLPHWAQLVLAFAVVGITWLMQQSSAGNLVLPATLVTVLVAVKTVIGLFSDAVDTSGGSGPKAYAGSLKPNYSSAPSAPPKSFRATLLFPATAVLLMGCTAAFFPTLDKVEQLVLNDLAAGKTPEQVEADVATLLCGSNVAPLCVDAVVVVNDVVTVLVDTGVLAKNPVALATAQKILTAEHAKIAARGFGR